MITLYLLSYWNYTYIVVVYIVLSYLQRGAIMDKFNALLAQATEEEVQEMMKAFETWYAVHYPDWEVYYMAVPR